MRHEKVFTDEELKEFEEQYGRNKGWTDDYIKIHPQTTTASLSITNENNSQNQVFIIIFYNLIYINSFFF